MLTGGREHRKAAENEEKANSTDSGSYTACGFSPRFIGFGRKRKIRLTCVEGTPSQHGLPPENCFDGDDHTKWCVTGNAVYVIFKAEKATKDRRLFSDNRR